MKTPARLRHSIVKFVLILLFIIMPLQNVTALSINGVPVTRRTSFAGNTQLTPPLNGALSYPTDPTADIPWSGGVSTVADIQAAFNNARTIENNQLGTSIPLMTLPTQTEWNGMSDGQKALWLINRERVDRGVAPLQGLEANVSSVAQYYADYLLDNNTWGHTADGRSPWQRLDDNPAIGACHDFLSVAENIYVFVTSSSSIPLPIERAIYGWMYEDGPCCSWGHRHAILWYPYNDNSGTVGSEGFLGIGRANGGPYQGPFSQPWNFAEMIVMNVFDPCASWNDPAPIVNSITRADPNPTSASSVSYMVTFSESVTGVGTNDFTLTVTGGISSASVNAVSGSGSTRTVTVNTGSGTGTLRLNVEDNDSIVDSSSNPLGGTGAGNGNYTSGDIYNIVLPNTDVHIGGTLMDDYYVPSGQSIFDRYGVNGGPVHVESTNGQPIFTSERAIYLSSFNSIVGYAGNQLTTEYWFTSYDDAGMITYLVIGNPDPALTAEVDVYIAGTFKGHYSIAPGQRYFARYGINAGPVHVVSTNGVNIFTSERTKFGNSFNEVMGYPGNQLTTEYWFTSYDDVGMITFLVVGNPHTSQTAEVDVYIAGTFKGHYSIAPGQRVFPRYSINNGPVHVVSTNGANVFASERTKFGNTFNEVLGFPGDQVSTDFWFTSYDDTSMITYLVVGNPHASQTAQVDVYVGGVKQNTNPIQIAPGQRYFARYGINSGPVHVVSTNGVSVFASERSKYLQSFNEILGIADTQLTTDYWFTSYDDAGMVTYLVLASP